MYNIVGAFIAMKERFIGNEWVTGCPYNLVRTHSLANLMYYSYSLGSSCFSPHDNLGPVSSVLFEKEKILQRRNTHPRRDSVGCAEFLSQRVSHVGQESKTICRAGWHDIGLPGAPASAKQYSTVRFVFEESGCPV